jgi:hypothetical protein
MVTFLDNVCLCVCVLCSIYTFTCKLYLAQSVFFFYFKTPSPKIQKKSLRSPLPSSFIFDVKTFTWEICILKEVIIFLISFNKYSHPILPPCKYQIYPKPLSTFANPPAKPQTHPRKLKPAHPFRNQTFDLCCCNVVARKQHCNNTGQRYSVLASCLGVDC